MSRRIRRLRSWMVLHGFKAKAIARDNGLSLRAVHRYIAGTMPSSTLRAWFLAQGCPAGNLPAAARKTTNIGKAA